MAEKRRVGRPRAAAPPAKRVKTSTPDKATTPAKETTPATELTQEEQKPTLLSNRITDSNSLPTLPEPQPINLTNDDYQSIASSAVLVFSLERSRQKWVSGTFFERYWAKPSTKKDAPPPPPNNPQKSWMKEIGLCTLVVEPLAFEVTAYFAREPGIHTGPAYGQPPQKHANQYSSQSAAQTGTASPYGTPYRPQPTYQSTPQPQPSYYQGRTLPPINGPVRPPMANTNSPSGQQFLPMINSHPHLSNRNAVSNPPAPVNMPAAPAPTANKASPDPVIQMLATRASTDGELKALMKVVATGNANQDQLRVFQSHIDELTAIIQRDKIQAEAAARAVAPMHPPPNAPPANMGYNNTVPPPNTASNVNSGYANRGPPPYPLPPPQPTPTARPHMQSTPQQYPAQPPRYPPIPNFPVILEFSGPSASSDRFLFPPHSILEFLSPYSLLASFMIFRKGSTAADPTFFDAETEYYEPVTVRVDVQERFRDILEYIRRSVKPAEEVKKWMEEKMRTCKRAERRFLALRLPHKSQIPESSEAPEEQAADVKKVKTAAKKDKEKEKTQEPKDVVLKLEEPGDGRRRSIKKSVRLSEAAAAGS